VLLWEGKELKMGMVLVVGNRRILRRKGVVWGYTLARG
jgi:hypothetical protein